MLNLEFPQVGNNNKKVLTQPRPTTNSDLVTAIFCCKRHQAQIGTSVLGYLRKQLLLVPDNKRIEDKSTNLNSWLYFWPDKSESLHMQALEIMVIITLLICSFSLHFLTFASGWQLKYIWFPPGLSSWFSVRFSRLKNKEWLQIENIIKLRSYGYWEKIKEKKKMIFHYQFIAQLLTRRHRFFL